MDLDEIRRYLPSYLSEDSTHSLFESLDQFPENIDGRLYADSHLEDDLIFQGDGLADLLVVNLPDANIRPTPCMVVSNTCDIDPDNRRNFPARVCYAPILNLEKYERLLLSQKPEDQQRNEDHVTAHSKAGNQPNILPAPWPIP